MTRLAVVLLLATSPALAQSPDPKPTAAPPPCQTAEHRQFDFWIGDWEVKNPAGQVVGTNRIEPIQNRCVLQENWTSGKGNTGTSFNMYFGGDRKWHQTWVDDSGGRLDLSGGLEGKKMRLLGEGPWKKDPSKRIRHEITWEPLEGGSVRQVWRTSSDEGKTWTVGFDGTYSKKR